MGINVLLDLFGGEPPYAGGYLYAGELPLSNELVYHFLR
jgi:hypothetical protein